jgi:hypothetical protein
MTPSLDTYQALANRIVHTLDNYLCFGLILQPAERHKDEDPNRAWEIRIIRISSDELLHFSETLEEAALVMSFVAESRERRLRVHDGKGNSITGTHLPSLIPESQNPITEALKEILPLTASNHSRLKLFDRIRARSETT